MNNTRKIFSICIHSGETILLSGWGKTQVEAIKNLKERFLEECVQGAVNICSRNNEYSENDISKFVLMKMKAKDHGYDQCRWSFDCYIEEHDPRPGDENNWRQIDAFHWQPKYPVKLGL